MILSGGVGQGGAEQTTRTERKSSVCSGSNRKRIDSMPVAGLPGKTQLWAAVYFRPRGNFSLLCCQHRCGSELLAKFHDLGVDAGNPTCIPHPYSEPELGLEAGLCLTEALVGLWNLLSIRSPPSLWRSLLQWEMPQSESVGVSPTSGSGSLQGALYHLLEDCPVSTPSPGSRVRWKIPVSGPFRGATIPSCPSR